MSILGKIFGKIFPSKTKDAAQEGANQSTASAPASAPTAAPAPASAASTASPSGTSGTSPQTATTMQQVDVEAMLNDMAQKNPEKLNWRSSIVDLMKLLGLDSSLDERQALAHELGYTGNTNDSASMNIWLHKQVMQKLAANGGKVPADLLD